MNHPHYVIVKGLLQRVDNLIKKYPGQCFQHTVCAKMQQVLWKEIQICYCELYYYGVKSLPGIFTKTCPPNFNLSGLRKEAEILKRELGQLVSPVPARSKVQLG